MAWRDHPVTRKVVLAKSLTRVQFLCQSFGRDSYRPTYTLSCQFVMDTHYEGGSKGDPVQITEGWTIPADWLHTLTGDASSFGALLIEPWWLRR